MKEKFWGILVLLAQYLCVAVFECAYEENDGTVQAAGGNGQHRSFQQFLAIEITEQMCPFLCNCRLLSVPSPFLLLVVFPIPSAYVHVLFGVF